MIDDFYGTYVPIGYKNTLDSIELKPQEIYHRKVYNKTGKKVLDMNGKWVLKSDNEVQFYSFFLNLDRDVSQFPELLKDTSGGVSTIFQSKDKTIQFCIGYYPDSNCYKRIK